MAVLCTLFLGACVAIGLGRSWSPYGALHFNTNAILSPPAEGMQVVVGPMNIREPGMQLMFHPWHPRPNDCPDGFTFDWDLIDTTSEQSAMGGAVEFDCRAYRAHPEKPPITIIKLPKLSGDHWVLIRPRGLSDFPDVEVYLSKVAPMRETAFIWAGILGSMFLALSGVAVYRYRRQKAALNTG